MIISTNAKYRGLFIYILPAAVLLISMMSGCKSPQLLSDSLDPDEIEESIFSARQDTVKIRSYSGGTEPALTEEDKNRTYYTIQIGAFKLPANADHAYKKARDRFNLETTTEYDSSDGLYKVTVGIFTEYDSAYAFRERIIQIFSNDYNDAWIVEITQRQGRK